MPYKDPEKRRLAQKEYGKRWYEKNRTKHIAGVNKGRRDRRSKWLEFKRDLKCTHCGAQHPAIIDFHHVVRDGEYRAVNKLVSAGNYNGAMEEIKKCIPLCANCHRILHFDEAQVHKKRRNKKRKAKKAKEQP